MTSVLITAVEAAAMIQPFVEVNAFNMLVDFRRKSPRYAGRVLKPPFCVKGRGRSAPIRYPESEIARIVRELIALKAPASGP